MKKRVKISNYKKLYFFVVFTGCLVLPGVAGAADTEVVCDSGSCDVISGAGSLFNESNMVPGQKAVRDIKIENRREESCGLNVKINIIDSTPYNLADKLVSKFKSSDVEFDSSYLADMDLKSVSLGDIIAGEVKTYEWALKLDPLTGNKYQGKSVSFDFDLIFECLLSTETPAPMIAGATDEKKIEQTGGDSFDEKPRVLGLSVFPGTGTPLARFITFFVAGLIILLPVIKYVLPKLSSR